MSEDYGESWDDYDSQFMFPGEDDPCTCDHETVDHDYDSCAIEGCPCEAHWEHT